MKNEKTKNKPGKKVLMKAIPKPGSYEAMMLAIKIAEATGVKVTWVR